MRHSLETGFLLDRLWYRLRGEMERSKQPALLALARVFQAAKIPYAIIGGVALQIHSAEPRTTLDIDVAILDRNRTPKADLERAGFRATGSFIHSENWVGPADTPIQFTDDPNLAKAIARAEAIEFEGVVLLVIRRDDLLREKLRSGSDPARRRSKRIQDLADAQALIEADPALASGLTAEERSLLERLP